MRQYSPTLLVGKRSSLGLVWQVPFCRLASRAQAAPSMYTQSGAVLGMTRQNGAAIAPADGASNMATVVTILSMCDPWFARPRARLGPVSCGEHG